MRIPMLLMLLIADECSSLIFPGARLRLTGEEELDEVVEIDHRMYMKDVSYLLPDRLIAIYFVDAASVSFSI